MLVLHEFDLVSSIHGMDPRPASVAIDLDSGEVTATGKYLEAGDEPAGTSFAATLPAEQLVILRSMTASIWKRAGTEMTEAETATVMLLDGVESRKVAVKPGSTAQDRAAAELATSLRRAHRYAITNDWARTRDTRLEEASLRHAGIGPGREWRVTDAQTFETVDPFLGVDPVNAIERLIANEGLPSRTCNRVITESERGVRMAFHEDPAAGRIRWAGMWYPGHKPPEAATALQKEAKLREALTLHRRRHSHGELI